MKMTLQEVIASIDGNPHTPFIIDFVKADGTIRQMVAIKRNRIRKDNGQADKGTTFKYMLQEKHVILVNELAGFITEKKRVKGTGTVHQLREQPNVNAIKLQDQRLIPKAIKINTIIQFNGRKVWA